MVVIETALATSAIGWVVTQLLNEVIKAYERVKTESTNVCKLRDLLERLGPAVAALRFVSDEEHPAGKWLRQLQAQLEIAREIANASNLTVQVIGACGRVLRIYTASKEAKKVRKNIQDLLIEASGFQWASGMDVERILTDSAKMLTMLSAAAEREERLFREIANMQTKDEILRGFEELQQGFSRLEQQVNSKVSDGASTSAAPTQRFHKDRVWYVPKVQVTFGGEAVMNRLRDYLLNGEYKMKVNPTGKCKKKAGLDGEYKKWVGLWGMGGVGKTVTASNIYHDSQIQNHFLGGVHWVTVSKEVVGPYPLYKQLVEQIQGRDYVSRMPEDLDTAKSYLMSLLGGDRVLLVLDDVWEDADGCKVLQYLDLVSEDKDSVILVTTRDKNVLQGVSDVCELFEIPILSEVDSWRLFTWHAFPHHRREMEVEVPDDLKEVAGNVAKECRGLPLALEVIGSTMADKKISAEQEKFGLNPLRIWQRALDQLKNAKYGKDDYQRLLQRLQLSVDSVRGSCLQDCFFYFAAFPEDADVSVEKLVHIWVAEGLVPDEVDYPGEVEGRFLLACLVAKSMVQMSQGDGENFEYTLCCKVHDVMRDVARHNLQWDFVKQEQIEASARECLYNPGRQQFELPKEWTKSATPSSAKRLSMQRNYLQRFPTSERFCACDLQVLILSENQSLQSLSLRSFQGLTNLKVLDLSYTAVERITGDLLLTLTSLVLLDLMECKSLVHISDEISNLESLEYLDLRYCDSLTNLPRLSELTKLQWFAMHAPALDEGAESDSWAHDLQADNDRLAPGDEGSLLADEDNKSAEGYEGENPKEDDQDLLAPVPCPTTNPDDQAQGDNVDEENSEFEDCYDELTANCTEAARTSCRISTYMLQKRENNGIPLVLPGNLKLVIIVGAPKIVEGLSEYEEGPLRAEKYILDMSSLHALEKLTFEFMMSFPVGMEKMHQLKSFDTMECIGRPIPALGKLDKLEYLKMDFYTTLGTESFGDEGAFPCLKTLEMRCKQGMDKMFVFHPGAMPRIENLKMELSMRNQLPFSIRELHSLRKIEFHFCHGGFTPTAEDFEFLFTRQDCFPHLEHLRMSGTIEAVEVWELLPTYVLEKEREGRLALGV